ncbi:endonuclease/exonuclease/phosphatase family protein [Flavilitoribacter nigricans]|uniref:Endonuclease/exonuclease/phosphatase domain-containing protein n=1 Tax=Flavilitoribacter nigricans (strain ATCC 23147 / DSM 23189 / NBRC 102662 / NCIMB 1420 / SS-2) TaxID=1122177 RepID=A0A2D0N526_FLAN2|nr:endonuclease/exonuclease/phosphatase family protein [Flavilitoribacter nigricans]PHN03498.1 hypothetical protein CRP01_26215 [Flavilitoribacter nigricans DSM 23189 = NBRC 102662]
METLIYALTYVFLLFSVIPLFPIERWWTRFLESLRPLKIIILSVLFFLILFLLPWSGFKFISMLLITVMVTVLTREIILYTAFSRCEIMDSTEKEPHITVLLHNILMSNDNIDALERSVDLHDPDILLLIEFTEQWQKLADGLRDRFRDYLEYPLESGYGLALYSRKKLKEKHIRFLVKEDIPSVDVITEGSNGRRIRVFGIHPAPPAPQFEYDTPTKDQEGYEVAKLIRKSKIPAIVAGDLNDINWSRYIKRFKMDCEILDPRIGRGFFPTFHANRLLINYPLDHIFASKDFDLYNFERVPLDGSDHHGLKAALVLREEG